MFFRKLLFILFFMIANEAMLATTFLPTPFEKQVMDSYGVIRAQYTGQVYKKLPSGEVVTQASFQIKESAGLKPNEMVNKNDFKVLFPGGKWQGVVYQVHGAPKFKSNEDVVLLLSKGQHGFVVKSLSLGKYNVYKKNGQYFLSSSVFPRHPKLGKIKYKNFEEIINHHFGSRFQNIKDDRYVYKNIDKPTNRAAFTSLNRRKKGRSIASLSDSNKKKAEEGSINVLWLVLLFGLMGTYSAYSLKKLSRKRKR